MFTIDIYDDERHTLTARIGELIPDNGRGSIWFGELLRTESGRVAYVETQTTRFGVKSSESLRMDSVRTLLNALLSDYASQSASKIDSLW